MFLCVFVGLITDILYEYRCTGKKVFNERAQLIIFWFVCYISAMFFHRYSLLVGLLYWKALMANSTFMGVYTSVSSLGNNTQGSGVNFINCKLGRSGWKLVCVFVCVCVCVCLCVCIAHVSVSTIYILATTILLCSVYGYECFGDAGLHQVA